MVIRNICARFTIMAKVEFFYGYIRGDKIHITPVDMCLWRQSFSSKASIPSHYLYFAPLSLVCSVAKINLLTDEDHIYRRAHLFVKNTTMSLFTKLQIIKRAVRALSGCVLLHSLLLMKFVRLYVILGT